jgi:flagellar hook capping protein FlgD
LSSALDTILDNVHIVKNQTQSAEYVYVPEIDEYTWFGDLQTMERNIGYKVHMLGLDTLIYPLAPITTRNQARHSRGFLDNSPEDWEIMNGNSDNMIAMLNIELNGESYQWSPENAVGVFDENNICRAHGIWQEAEGIEEGFWYFTIVGNLNETQLNICVIDSEGLEVTSDEAITFMADTVIGNPIEPMIFNILVTAGDETEIVAVNCLEQNIPNPFNPVTMINFSLAENDNVEISVYSLRGEKVRVLIREPRDAGAYSVIWDGTDNSGNSVASGIYFYSIKTSKYSASRKMVMIK